MAVTQRLTLKAAALLTVPPLLWSGNVVIGRVIIDQVSPMTLNLLRWGLAFLILVVLAGRVIRRGSPLWAHARHYAALGLLGVGCYNALQYLALQTSSPLNVTLVASSLPLFMLAVGRVFFDARVSARQVVGALLSMTGVVIVLARGSLTGLASFQVVPGDLITLVATLSWSGYSWLLQRTREPPEVTARWSSLLLAQTVFGVGWGMAFAAGEWSLGRGVLVPSWGLGLAVAYVAVGPAVLAFAAWGKGVALAGPAIAGFFSNLVPVFVAVLSTVLLNEPPRLYHATAFALIVAGIVVSSGRARRHRLEPGRDR